MSLRGGHRPTWQSVLQAFPFGVVLRAAKQNLTIASGNCIIMYRWHGAAVMDEGLASPSGRGAGGGEGDFCPLSRLRRQLPQSGSQEETDCDRRESPEGATPVCAPVRNDMRFSTLHTLSTIVPKGHRTYSLFTIHFSLFTFLYSLKTGRGANAPRPCSHISPDRLRRRRW